MKQSCPLFITAEAHPSQIAFMEGDRNLTFLQANVLVEDLVKKLSQMKLGDRVSILSANNIEMILLVFALQRLGVTAVLHNTRLRPEDWKAQAELAGVEVGFVSDEFKNTAPFETVLPLAACDELSRVDFSELGSTDFGELSRAALTTGGRTACGELSRTNFEKEAVVVFTSGSTGVGKGVRLSLENLISNASASNKVNDLVLGDTWLASLPFFHVGGLSIVFRTILAGASALITNSQSASETLSNLTEVSHISLVPSVLAEILEFEGGSQRLGKLKNILLGGAPTDTKLLEKIQEFKLPVRTSYGMTETSSHICMLDKKEFLQVEDLKTSGKLLENVEAKIAEDGELCLRGPSIFKGYLGERDADDWFFTGDLGSVDSQGRLIVEGRKDRTIISGGENINPKQIEDLALSCAGVREAVVVGIDDTKWGQRPALYVVTAADFSLALLNEKLNQELPKFKIPDKVIVLERLPKTALGKVDYKALSDLL